MTAFLEIVFPVWTFCNCLMLTRLGMHTVYKKVEPAKSKATESNTIYIPNYSRKKTHVAVVLVFQMLFNLPSDSKQLEALQS